MVYSCKAREYQVFRSTSLASRGTGKTNQFDVNEKNKPVMPASSRTSTVILVCYLQCTAPGFSRIVYCCRFPAASLYITRDRMRHTAHMTSRQSRHHVSFPHVIAHQGTVFSGARRFERVSFVALCPSPGGFVVLYFGLSHCGRLRSYCCSKRKPVSRIASSLCICV